MIAMPFPSRTSLRRRLLVAIMLIAIAGSGCTTSATTALPSSATPAASASAASTGVPTPAAGTPTATSAPTATAPATATLSPTPPVTPAATASGQAAGGSWQSAGTMQIAHAMSHAVLLPDGRVLVVGNDGGNLDGVRDDSSSAELWDPSTNDWQASAGLNAPRSGFAAVAIPDGRVLVTGGMNRGTPASTAEPGDACWGTGAQSYSSTYLYDPRAGQPGWSRAGLLGTARTEPTMAVLGDGRVLVFGGFYRAGTTGATAPGAALAAYHPRGGGSARRPVADVGPNFTVPPLATAELFDPTTGTWSPTGPMHYARYGAAAATLADGRVLVVGSVQGTWVSGGGEVLASDAALDSAEIYDPQTGRFALTGNLPAGDQRSGAYGALAGSLVALPDGGALLVGNERDWKHGGWDTRSFRYDVRTGQWSEVGRAFLVEWDPDGNAWKETPGVGGRSHAMVALLPDGRLLVAGGDAFATDTSASRDAAMYDPATNRWSALPPLPEARSGGAAVTLSDGSVLLAGGYNEQHSVWASCNEPLGMASAIRFVPTR